VQSTYHKVGEPLPPPNIANQKGIAMSTQINTQLTASFQAQRKGSRRPLNPATVAGAGQA
jgi:hypothetical protein